MTIETTLVPMAGGHLFRFAHPTGAFRVEVFFGSGLRGNEQLRQEYASLITQLDEYLEAAVHAVLKGDMVQVELPDDLPPDPQEEAAIKAAREKLGES